MKVELSGGRPNVRTRLRLRGCLLAGLWLTSGSLSKAATYDKGVQQASIQPRAGRAAYVLAGRLWVADLAAGAGKAVPTAGDRVAGPVLSPDGSSVVYLEWEANYHVVTLKLMTLADPKTREVYRTKEDLREIFDVDFDRGLVAFSIAGSGLRELSLTEGEPRALTTNSSDRAPRYSSDGRYLAFIRSTADSQDIWVLERSSGGSRRVQSSVTAGEVFDWSPDDSTFVFESHDTGNMELWTLPATGGAARRLTHDVAQEHRPVWAADGRIYFHKNRKLWRMAADGTGVEPIRLESSLPDPVPRSLFIRGANLLDVKTGTWRIRQDLLVENGVISAMAASGKLPVPPGVPVLEAIGLWAIPGLIDAHTHYVPWMGPLMRAYGVTVIRDLGSSAGVDWILDERDQTRAGRIQGPTIIAAGPVINGSGPGHIGQILTDNLQLVRKTVGWLADQGVDLIKIGSENTEPVLRAVIETAHARNLPVWGHISLVRAQEAIRVGQNGIEHLRGLAWSSLPEARRPDPVPRRLNGMRREAAAWWDVSADALRQLAAEMAQRKVGLDPTLTVMRVFARKGAELDPDVRARIPERILKLWERNLKEGPMGQWGPEDPGAFAGAEENQHLFVKAFHEAGGLLTTGSDVGPDFVVPGLSIHQEMARLVDVGLRPLDAIRAATLNGAQACRIVPLVGTLEVGKWGNIVVLDDDPLKDIHNTLRIRWVIDRGAIVHRSLENAQSAFPTATTGINPLVNGPQVTGILCHSADSATTRGPSARWRRC